MRTAEQFPRIESQRKENTMCSAWLDTESRFVGKTDDEPECCPTCGCSVEDAAEELDTDVTRYLDFVEIARAA